MVKICLIMSRTDAKGENNSEITLACIRSKRKIPVIIVDEFYQSL